MNPRFSFMCNQTYGRSLLIIAWMMAGNDLRAEESPEDPSRSAFLTDVLTYGDNGRPQIDLSGAWEFRRDAEQKGGDLGWHRGEGAFERTIQIPGAPQAQGIGEPTLRQKTFFMEPFWVRRRFNAPEVTPGERVWLRLGGIQPAAEIYLNGTRIGYTKSSRTQQRVDVTPLIEPHASNLIAIKVCDFPEVRLDGLWEMAECGMYWTGVYRPVRLEITQSTSLIDYYLTTDLDDDMVRVTTRYDRPPERDLNVQFNVYDDAKIIAKASVRLKSGASQADAEIKIDDYSAWSPENPRLYRLEILLEDPDSGEAIDNVLTRFGMREIETKGTKILLNGRPIFLRAFGDDHYYPETLCPPADKQWYLDRLKRARAYGMNAAKGCVETMTPEYVEAADEAGIIIIQEMPFGLSGLRANRYTIEKPFMDFEMQELEGLIRQSRNHASILAYSMSSELEFSNQTQQSFDFFSRDLVKRTRELAPHALAIDCTGYVNALETDKGTRDTDFYASIIPTWMKRMLDETPVATDRKRPTILHEYNWWSCYPDPDDRSKYEGMQLKPFWLDTLVESTRKNGQEDLVPTYRKNSHWLQAICRKDGIEYARRNPDAEGFILWLLIDFGQYSEGLLDDFWNPKNISAEEFLQSNGDTVIVLAEEGKRCLPNGTHADIPLAISHYGSSPLSGTRLEWKVEGELLEKRGTLEVPELVCGELTQAGSVSLDLPDGERAGKFTLHVTLEQGDRRVNTNQWSFWSFPETPAPWMNPTDASSRTALRERGVVLRVGEQASMEIPADAQLVLAEQADASLAAWVEQGGRCLLLARGTAIENRAIYYGTVSFYPNYRTIPWNAGTSGNSGTVVTPHPALAAFPHSELCDLHFVWMFRDVLPMEFEPLREYGVEPIIRMIDHYASNRNNAHMLEFRVGKGKVIATTLNILPLTGTRIEARSLLECLADYARSEDFAPKADLPREVFAKWFGPHVEKSETDGPNQLLK